MYALGARCGTAAPGGLLSTCLPTSKVLAVEEMLPQISVPFFAAGLLRIQGVGTFFFSLLACFETRHVVCYIQQWHRTRRGGRVLQVFTLHRHTHPSRLCLPAPDTHP